RSPNLGPAPVHRTTGPASLIRGCALSGASPPATAGALRRHNVALESEPAFGVELLAAETCDNSWVNLVAEARS
ncbi:MAG: hypothetical protein ACYDC0_15045, partial [Acidimicrobiales bacterium]